MTPDALVSANVRTLAAANGTSVPQLAGLIGLSRAAFYDRLAGKTSWLYREAIALADYFEVDISRFTIDPRTRVTSVSGSAWTPISAGQPHLSLVAV